MTDMTDPMTDVPPLPGEHPPIPTSLQQAETDLLLAIEQLPPGWLKTAEPGWIALLGSVLLLLRKMREARTEISPGVFAVEPRAIPGIPA